MLTKTNLVETSGITICRHSTNSATHITLPDISLANGQHTLVLGASGTGKTSLLLMLAGLLRPTAGTVKIQEHPIYTYGETKRDAFRAANLGIIFQTLQLLPDLTARQNILLGSSQHTPPIHEQLLEITTALGIEGLLERYPKQLSQGQAQRVAIARAIVGKPALILADEPTAALDDANTKAVMALLLTLAAQHNSTLLIATHDTRLKPYVTQEVQL